MNIEDQIEQEPLEVVVQIDNTDELMKYFGIYKNECED
jgi:hypothetical protein